MSDESFSHALHLVQLDRPAEALQKLGEGFDPENEWHWWLRAVALVELERYEYAQKAAEQGLALGGDAEMLLGVLARCRLERGDLPGAEEAILGALRLDAEDANNLALYARILMGAGQMEKARKLIERARRLDPENAFVVRMQSVLAMAQGDMQQALERSRELLAIDPEDVYGHRITGAVLHGRGDIDAASRHLRSAVVLDPAQQEIAEIARENRLWQNPFMWPLRPLQRYGMGPVWLTGVAAVFLSARFAPPQVATALFVLWIAYCVYSWVVPPLVRRYVNRV